jgi:hypothetical protein
MTLMVTQGGEPMKDQRLGIRLFKDAASVPARYRIRRELEPKYGWGWFIYYGGKKIQDTWSCRNGYKSPGSALNYLVKFNKWRSHHD